MSELIQLIRREILSLTQGVDNGPSREIEALKKQITQLSSDVSGLSIRVAQQQQSITSITAQLGTIDTRLSDISNRLTENERAIASITADVGGINNSVSALGQRVDAGEQRISELDTITNDLSVRASTLEADVGALRTDLAALNTRVTTELSDVRSSLSALTASLQALESAAVTSVGQGLEKTGNNVRVIAGNGMWFNSQNQLQLDLSGQMKGVGFDGSGMVAKIDTNYFRYDANGNITLSSTISDLPARTQTLEAMKIDAVAPPLAINESGGVRLLRLLYEASDLRVVNQVLALVNKVTMPSFRFPLELDSSANIVTLSSNYRMRTGQWSGDLEYQTPTLSWRVPVTVRLMRVNDWLLLSFDKFSTNGILPSGKFVMNFVTGLSPGWQTGSTQPSSTTDPMSTTFAAVQFVDGSNRVDAFRILGISEWVDGELEISNYGGTYAAHRNVDWAPMTIMYPCLG
uniref:Sigma-1 protein n=2 Tax=Mammalian orthoreovirus 2 TaxID=538121 RepID=Q2PPA9_REOVJ|nr:sigma-1 protein [Mammalian orthoreovirus 2]ABT17125.1 cell attachment protein sigma-1 [Mammalian orthoreovirus 2]